MSGLSAHTIRAWEKRYQAITPERTETGKRVYNEQELDRLKTLALLVNLGSSISQIANLSDTDLNQMLQKLTQSKSKWTSPKPMEKDEAVGLIGPIVQDLLAYRLEAVSEKIVLAREATTSRELVFEVLLPLLKRVKAMQVDGSLGPAQVQSLKSIIRLQTAWALVPIIERPSDKKIFIASIAGIDPTSTILASLLCRHHHKNFFYSHIPLPVDAMMETATALSSRIVILHSEEPIEKESLLQLQDMLPPKAELWVLGTNTYRTLKQTRFYQDYSELDQLLSHA